MIEHEKQKRQFETQNLFKHGRSYEKEKAYDELKKEVFSVKSALKENPLGVITLSFDNLPETLEEYTTLTEELLVERNQDGKIVNRWYNKKYDGFNSEYGSSNNSFTNYSFYSNKNLWRYIKEHPEHEFPLYGIEHGFVFTTLFGKAIRLPDTTITSVRYNDELLAIETSDDMNDEGKLPVLKNVAKQEIIKQEFKELEKNVFDIDNFHTPELDNLYNEAEALKAELQAKMDEMYAMQAKMRNEIEKKIKAAQKEIFLLETDFYALLSRWGETVHFDRITQGQKAPVDHPLVVQQKTVYLAEDLPRLKHFYNQEVTTLEELLQTSPEFIEHISPNDKSVTFIKNQRVEGQYLAGEDDSILRFIHDVFPSAVGILVRDGENMYLGWADASKVQVGEDSFASNSSHEEVLESFDDIIKNHKMVSRYFILNILIGLVNSHRALVELPVTIDTPEQLLNSPYIAFSNADNQIVTNYYPSMAEYMDYVNPYTATRDKLYVLWRLVDGTERGWNNNRYYNRGKGDSRLTQNAYVPEGFNTVKDVTYNSNGHKAIYVSAEVNSYWEESKISPAFRVEQNEFINTTFLTSEMIEEWLSNKNIGTITSDRSRIHFDYMVDILLELQKQVQEVQTKEQLLIPSKDYNSDLVASFKVIKGVKHFTEHQAKRYVKWVSGLSAEDKERYSHYRYVLENIEDELSTNLRKRYIVGFTHPTEPIFYTVLREVISEAASTWYKPAGEYLEYAELIRPINEHYFSEITTFGQRSRAQQLAERLTALSPEDIHLLDDENEKDKVLQSFCYKDRQSISLLYENKQNPVWQVFEVDQIAPLRKQLYEIRDQIEKDDPNRYDSWR
uniref:OmpH family outer membrane protein n=1 Tax=Streptococcus pluranimalium TaxID=82348 RepID=UPI003F68E295